MLLETDQVPVEDPVQRMQALPIVKSKRLILQLPTVTPSPTRLWLSIQFI